MRYFFRPKNNVTDKTIVTALLEDGTFSGQKNLQYKNKSIINLYEVSLDFVKFWENSIKNNGEDKFKADLYSKTENEIVRKHEFPRNNKRKIRRNVSKMKKK